MAFLLFRWFFLELARSKESAAESVATEEAKEQQNEKDYAESVEDTALAILLDSFMPPS